jgi:hypothetical protein
MSPEQIKEIIEYLEELITPVGKAMYELLLKQVYVKLIYNSFSIFVFLLFCIWLWSFVKRAKKYVDHPHYNINCFMDNNLTEALILTMCICISALLAINGASYIINFLVNPNWLVLELLKETVK